MAFDLSKYDYAKELGISLIPIRKISKEPYHPYWTTREEFRPEEFGEGDNVAGRWGKKSNNITDIDCDIKEACRIAAEVFSQGICYGRKSNPASHYLVKSPDAKTKKFLFEGEMIIELRSNGQQSVLPPSIHKEGEPYEWERRDNIFTFDKEHLTKNVSRIAGCSLLASYWKGGRHEKSITLAGLFVKNGVGKEDATRLMELICIGAEDEEMNDRLTSVETTYNRYENGESTKSNIDIDITVIKKAFEWLGIKLKKELKLYTLIEFFNLPTPPWVVDDILIAASMIEVIGPPKVSKTYVALHIALSIATGQKDIFGHTIRKSGPVIFVIAEGAGSFEFRIRKWLNEAGISDYEGIPFFPLPEAIDIRNANVQAQIERLCIEHKPVLIIIDTLSRCIPGANEDSAQDMSLVVQYCDYLKNKFQIIIMLVHHPTKRATDGHGRGSGAIFGAVDTEIQVKQVEKFDDDSAHITIKCGKQKDGPEFKDIQVMRRVGPVLDKEGRKMADEKSGKEITNCYLELRGEKDKPNLGIDIIELLKDGEGIELDINEIRKALNRGKNPVTTELEKLVMEEKITYKMSGRKKYYSAVQGVLKDSEGDF